MSLARVFIAIPVPPPSRWVLLRDRRNLPAHYTIIGSLTVGSCDPPALGMDDALLLEAPAQIATTTTDARDELIGRLVTVVQAVAGCADCCQAHAQLARQVIKDNVGAGA